jgi:diguanylate cyclase (GGDEF)-like protein
VTGPVEWRFRQLDGSWLSAEILATNLTGDATVRGIVLNTRDVSERKRLEEQLTHQAFHDPLTGLANRALFRDRVSHALALSQRQGNPITVLFLDLDDFKPINDTHGHDVGDEVLQQVARRIREASRDTDLVARQGGDEFLVLLADMDAGTNLGAALASTSEASDRIDRSLAEPIRMRVGTLSIRASIGSALFPFSAGDARTLLRLADEDMYARKRRRVQGPSIKRFA